MLILLPPSEGKTAPGEGRPLKLTDLVCPSLNPLRQETLDALVALCRDDPRAGDILGLGPTQTTEVDRNARLETAPTAPAHDVYTGVLFAALDLRGMPAEVLARADDQVLIASALFGMVAPTDHIPAYRMSAGVRLPGLPSARRRWGDALREALDELPDPGPVLDLRSGAYAALYRPPSAGGAAGAPSPDGPRRDRLGREWVDIQVLLDRGGRRSVVSHHNKATKGRIVADLLRSGTDALTGNEVAVQLADLGWRAERAGGTLRVVVNAV